MLFSWAIRSGSTGMINPHPITSMSKVTNIKPMAAFLDVCIDQLIISEQTYAKIFSNQGGNMPILGGICVNTGLLSYLYYPILSAISLIVPVHIPYCPCPYP